MGDDPYRVDISSPTGLRMPRGNESGAYDDYWIPGGYTKGGISEAVIDSVSEDLYTFLEVF